MVKEEVCIKIKWCNLMVLWQFLLIFQLFHRMLDSPNKIQCLQEILMIEALKEHVRGQ